MLCFFGKPNSFDATFMSTSILFAMQMTGISRRYSRSSLYHAGRFLYVCLRVASKHMMHAWAMW